MGFILAMVSLAVDVGRVQLAKTELRRAADAAARYAASGISSSTHIARAQTAAAENTVDGASLALLTSDIELGNWTGGVFTAAGTPSNAIRVTARRAQSRSTGVRLYFAGFIGINFCDVSAVAIAQATANTPTYGITGLNSVTINSASAGTGEYNSATGTYTSGVVSNSGSIASNGTISLNKNTSIGGTIYYNTKSAPTGGTDYDAITRLSSTLTATTPTAGKAATTNDNSNVSKSYLSGGNFSIGGNSSLTLPGGTYYFDTFSCSGNSRVTFTGAATVYINGDVTIRGTVNTLGNVPSNLQIKLLAAANFDLNAKANLFAQLDCPTSDVSLRGNDDLVGSVVAKTIDLGGNAKIFYDTALGTAGGGGTSTISMVD